MNNADKIISAWNAQADEFNYWENLEEDEKLDFAFSCGRGAYNDLADSLKWMKLHVEELCLSYDHPTPNATLEKADALLAALQSQGE